MKQMRLRMVLGAGLASLLLAATTNAAVSENTAKCLECHADSMPGILDQWLASTHWQAGFGCYECHLAQKGEPDAMDHNGFYVATIVPPKDCAKCHPNESAEQEARHHAKGGDSFKIL